MAKKASPAQLKARAAFAARSKGKKGSSKVGSSNTGKLGGKAKGK